MTTYVTDKTKKSIDKWIKLKDEIDNRIRADERAKAITILDTVDESWKEAGFPEVHVVLAELRAKLGDMKEGK